MTGLLIDARRVAPALGRIIDSANTDRGRHMESRRPVGHAQRLVVVGVATVTTTGLRCWLVAALATVPMTPNVDANDVATVHCTCDCCHHDCNILCDESSCCCWKMMPDTQFSRLATSPSRATLDDNLAIVDCTRWDFVETLHCHVGRRRRRRCHYYYLLFASRRIDALATCRGQRIQHDQCARRNNSRLVPS